MKIQVTRVLKDELARLGEPLPQWIDIFLQSINQFIDQVGRSLKGQLNFKDNILSKTVTINLTHATEYSVSPAISGVTNLKVSGVIALQAQNAKNSSGVLLTSDTRNVITGFGFNLKGNGLLGIVAQFQAGAGTTADVSFLILYG